MNIQDLSPHHARIMTDAKYRHELFPPKVADSILTIFQRINNGEIEATARQFMNWMSGLEEKYANFPRSERWWLAENARLYQEADHDANSECARRERAQAGKNPVYRISM